MRAGAVLVAVGVLMWFLVFEALPGGSDDDENGEAAPTPPAVAGTETPDAEDDSAADDADAAPADDADDDATDDAAGSGSGDVYVVEAGDNLGQIANAHGLTLEELLAANPQITDPTAIAVGQEIAIP